MGGSNAAISQIEDVISQLDWLTAELEAQRPLLARIPDVQLKARPLADQPSIVGYYAEMLSRERESLATLSVSWSDGDCDEQNADCVLQTLISGRTALLVALRAKAVDDWTHHVSAGSDQSLLDWAFRITLRDGETLRKVAERLHESRLSLGRKRSDGP